jgi:tight adherence protein C
MIELLSYIFMAISIIIFLSIAGLFFYRRYKHTKKLDQIFNLTNSALLSKEENQKKIDFDLKLSKAGITQREFTEVIIGSVLVGFSLLGLLFFMKFSITINVIIIVSAIAIAIFMPLLYLEEQIKDRIKRIDNDLAIFLDLLIIILEGGGGLNNAIDRVTTDGEGVLGKDLLEESKKFKYEYITYSSKIAYHNLAERTGSDAIATIVGFMKLSEETGIGVKSIFENQAQEIKAAEMLNIEKGAASMNIGITLVMFIFIIPAVIAMIAFPMSAGALIDGF